MKTLTTASTASTSSRSAMLRQRIPARVAASGLARRRASMASETSEAVTRYPRAARGSDCRPVPQVTSSTSRTSRPASSRKAKSRKSTSARVISSFT